MFQSRYQVRLGALLLAFMLAVIGPAATLNVHAAPAIGDPQEGRAGGWILPEFFGEDIEIEKSERKSHGAFAEESLQPMDTTEGTENEVSYDDRFAGLLGDGLVHQERFAKTRIRYGVDVSAHQEEIDWAKAAAAGVEFAFIRVGYRGWGEEGTLVKDPYFDANIQGAMENGIAVGVYFFSQAISVEEAIEEAQFALAPLKGYSLDLPVVFDVEYASKDGLPVGRLYDANLDAETRTAVTLAFLEYVESKGYRGCLYGSKSALQNDIKCDMTQIEGSYPIWLANYTRQTTYAGEFAFWQHSAYAKVDGIPWQADVDVWYDDGSLWPDAGVWEKTEGFWYYLDRKTGIPLTGWQTYRDQWYYLDEDDGRMFTGWLTQSGKWYYLKPNGAMATGWQQVAGNWYYFSENGRMLTGWREISGKWYYFTANGRMLTGWQKISGSWYYFTAGGRMVTGWLSLGGSWYYMAASGKMLSGWQKIGGTNYYFHEGGTMATGWLSSQNRWYYLRESGKMHNGWLQLDGAWYFFAEDGTMVTGWQTIGERRYYFRASGKMETGWMKQDGIWYHFGESGAMTTGWFSVGGKTYYCNSRGELLTGGRYKIGGKWYSFADNGELK